MELQGLGGHNLLVSRHSLGHMDVYLSVGFLPLDCILVCCAWGGVCGSYFLIISLLSFLRIWRLCKESRTLPK
jgi:hypothetical protein